MCFLDKQSIRRTTIAQRDAEHKLDCSFFAGRCPSGLESMPLYEDPYYLVTAAGSDLAHCRAVKVIPLKEHLTRTVSLLLPRESDRSHLTNVFLRLTQQQVEKWKTTQKPYRL